MKLRNSGEVADRTVEEKREKKGWMKKRKRCLGSREERQGVVK